MSDLVQKSNLERLRVVLVSTRNPLNIGAAARAMANFGFSRLRLVSPYVASFQEARSAVKAGDLLKTAKVFDSIAEAVSECSLVVGTSAARDRVPKAPVKTLTAGAQEIRQALGSGPVAILFGSEKRGLSNHDLSQCHFVMRIPTEDRQPSMNLGQAVAVCLWELVRESSTRQKDVSAQPASAAEIQRLTGVLLDGLDESGYTKRNTRAATEEKMRLMIRRMNLSGEDAELLLGMLRKMLWKMKH